jgi:hypothetical protein
MTKGRELSEAAARGILIGLCILGVALLLSVRGCG